MKPWGFRILNNGTVLCFIIATITVLLLLFLGSVYVLLIFLNVFKKSLSLSLMLLFNVCSLFLFSQFFFYIIIIKCCIYYISIFIIY